MLRRPELRPAKVEQCTSWRCRDLFEKGEVLMFYTPVERVVGEVYPSLEQGGWKL